MKALVVIDMDNAAFDELPGCELSSILATLAERVAHHNDRSEHHINLYDSNGNKVGYFETIKTEEEQQ